MTYMKRISHLKKNSPYFFFSNIKDHINSLKIRLLSDILSIDISFLFD
jgi:hypothetical protein